MTKKEFKARACPLGIRNRETEVAGRFKQLKATIKRFSSIFEESRGRREREQLAAAQALN
jgi:hypothetical protein